jgi:hypothetical protein
MPNLEEDNPHCFFYRVLPVPKTQASLSRPGSWIQFSKARTSATTLVVNANMKITEPASYDSANCVTFYYSAGNALVRQLKA